MAKRKQLQISTFGSRVTSVVSVALLLIVLGMIALVGVTSYKLGQQVKSNFGFTVELADDHSEQAVERLTAILTDAPFVESFKYVTPEEVFADAEADMGELELLTADDFPGEFQVRVSPEYAQPDSIEALRPRFENDSDVGFFTPYESQGAVNNTLGKVQWILIALGAALLAISIVLINNTVSLSVYSRRFLIHTMKLVGATPAFIRRPFIKAGIVNGLIASLIADAVVCGIIAYAVSSDNELAALLPWQEMWWIPVAITVVGVVVCALAAAMSAQRYLRREYDRLFMK